MSDYNKAVRAFRSIARNKGRFALEGLIEYYRYNPSISSEYDLSREDLIHASESALVGHLEDLKLKKVFQQKS